MEREGNDGMGREMGNEGFLIQEKLHWLLIIYQVYCCPFLSLLEKRKYDYWLSYQRTNEVAMDYPEKKGKTRLRWMKV